MRHIFGDFIIILAFRCAITVPQYCRSLARPQFAEFITVDRGFGPRLSCNSSCPEPVVADQANDSEPTTVYLPLRLGRDHGRCNIEGAGHPQSCGPSTTAASAAGTRGFRCPTAGSTTDAHRRGVWQCWNNSSMTASRNNSC